MLFLLFLLSECFKPVVISIMKATHLQPVYKYNSQTVGNREAKYHTDKKKLSNTQIEVFFKHLSQKLFLQKYRYIHKNAKMTPVGCTNGGVMQQFSQTLVYKNDQSW